MAGLETLELDKIKRNISYIFRRCFLYMVPAVGIEPTRPQGTRDFESRQFTSSTTPAYRQKFLKEQEIFKNYRER
jgi:hypothetical protein